MTKLQSTVTLTPWPKGDLTVTGPTIGADHQGRPWYWYRAIFDLPTTPDDAGREVPH